MLRSLWKRSTTALTRHAWQCCQRPSRTVEQRTRRDCLPNGLSAMEWSNRILPL